jgi:hypothetical protein
MVPFTTASSPPFAALLTYKETSSSTRKLTARELNFGVTLEIVLPRNTLISKTLAFRAHIGVRG